LLPGQVLVVYAYGLGRTYPDPVVGTEPSRPLPLREPIAVRLEWLAPNGGLVERQDVQPDYAGLTPSGIGLYQVNLTIPAPPEAIRPCESLPRSTNLRISLTAPGVEDSVEICVPPSN